MWKYLNESVQGTSHRQVGLGCQDNSFVTPYRVDDDEIIILACADGAGSAKEAQAGSSLSCATIVACITDYFERGHDLAELTEEIVREWVRALHLALATESDRLQIPIREMASTLLFGVVGRNRAMFGQVGDGAIIIQESGEYRTVFWPQQGEYLNTTYFVTDSHFEKTLEIRFLEAPIEEMAMFTDGLQMLALNFANKTVHAPFFRPMFDSLRAASESQDLIVPLKQFLDSKVVNDRTDDDKTLILAIRIPNGNATV